jgi:hypothetical protein
MKPLECTHIIIVLSPESVNRLTTAKKTTQHTRHYKIDKKPNL